MLHFIVKACCYRSNDHWKFWPSEAIHSAVNKLLPSNSRYYYVQQTLSLPSNQCYKHLLPEIFNVRFGTCFDKMYWLWYMFVTVYSDIAILRNSLTAIGTYQKNRCIKILVIFTLVFQKFALLLGTRCERNVYWLINKQNL